MEWSTIAGSSKNDGKWLHGATASGTARKFTAESHFDPPTSYPGTKGVWIEDDFKLLDGKLYNLKDDPQEKTDLAKNMPERLLATRKALGEWQTSVALSLCGLDYKQASVNGRISPPAKNSTLTNA